MLRMDLPEWRRAIGTLFGAFKHGGRSVVSRSKRPPSPAVLWEELDRLYDSLPGRSLHARRL